MAFVAPIIAGLAASALPTALGLSGIAATIVSGVIKLGVGLLTSALTSKPTQSLPNLAGFSAEAVNRTQALRQPITAAKMIVGDVRVGGALTFVESTNNNHDIHLVTTVANHTVASFESFYLNADPIYPDQLDADGWVSAGKYKGKVRLLWDDGSATGQPFPELVEECEEWLETHRQQGHAKFVATLKFDEDLFPTAIPNPSARVRGLMPYDPRTGHTKYSPNGALVTPAYMTRATKAGGMGVKQSGIETVQQIAAANIAEEIVPCREVAHKVLSVNAGANRIDIDQDVCLFQSGDRVKVSVEGGSVPGGLSASESYFVTVLRETALDSVKCRIALAATYDAAISKGPYVDITGSGSGTITITKTGEPRYTSSGVIESDRKPVDILNDLRSSFAGRIVPVGGTWLIKPGAFELASPVFDENDFRSAIRVVTKRSRRERFNAVKGVYASPLNLGNPSDYPPVTSSAFEAEDGGETEFGNLPLPFTGRPATAQRIAKIELNRHRRQQQVVVPVNLRGFRAVAAGYCRLSYAKWGWSEKVFEVVDWSLAPDRDANGNPVLGVDLQLQESDAAVFDFDPDSDEVVPKPAARTNLPSSTAIVAPGEPQVTEELYETRGGSGVKARAIATTSSPDGRVSGYQWGFKIAGAASFTDGGVTPDGRLVIDDVKPGVYSIRVRAVTTFGKKSDWVERGSIEVLGLGAEPADVSGLTLTQVAGIAVMRWAKHPDLDVRVGGELHFRHAKDPVTGAWETSQSIGEAVVGSETQTMLPLKPGLYLVKARDALGNWSVNAATVVATGAQAVAFANVTSLSAHPSFTGTKTDTVAASGVLALAGAGTVDDIPDVDAVVSWDAEGGIKPDGYYYFASGLDLSAKDRVRLRSVLSTQIINAFDLIDQRAGLVDSWVDIDGAPDGSLADLFMEFRRSPTDPAGTPSWGDWTRFESTEEDGGWFEFRARLISKSETVNIECDELTVQIDEVA